MASGASNPTTGSSNMMFGGEGMSAQPILKPKTPPIDVGEYLDFGAYQVVRYEPDLSSDAVKELNEGIASAHSGLHLIHAGMPLAIYGVIHNGFRTFSLAVGTEQRMWYAGHRRGPVDIGLAIVGIPELKTLFLRMLPHEAFLGRLRMDEHIAFSEPLRVDLSYDPETCQLNFTDAYGVAKTISLPDPVVTVGNLLLGNKK